MTDDLDAWRAYRRTKDPKVRDRLIEKNLVLVKYAAARIAGRLPSHLRLEDLYSAGLLGFLDAVEDYDPERGVDFSAYASPRIRGSIFDELRRLDCVPRRVRRKIRDAEHAIEVLSQRLDRAPSEDEVATELGMEVPEYRRLLGEGVTLLSLDSPATHQEDGVAPFQTLEDGTSPNPFQSLVAKERRDLLGRLIERLPTKERQVLTLYYHEELTMQEVGEVLGVTESRISQLHSSAVLHLRAALRRQRVVAADLGAVVVAAPRAGAPR